MPSQTIICCICSREKDESPNPLPARERYLGSHVKIAEEAARKENLPFFILSGKYGLLAADELVEFYDHKLEACGVVRLMVRLVGQFVRLPFYVKEIRFYTKTKPTWQPYLDALRQAADKTKIALTMIELSDDA